MGAVKNGTIIFRVPEPYAAQFKTLAKEEITKVVGLKSEDQFARKLVVDFLTGRLVYLDQSSRYGNPLLHGERAPAAAAG